MDRGYDDYVCGRISEEFWTRKSEQWEDERSPSAAAGEPCKPFKIYQSRRARNLMSWLGFQLHSGWIRCGFQLEQT